MAGSIAQSLDDRYRQALHSITGSGPEWVLAVFRWSVVQLVALADALGISYEALNVWLFVVLLPAALMGSVALNVYLVRRVRRLSGGSPAGRRLWVGLLLACGLQSTLGAQTPTRTVRRYGVFRVVHEGRPAVNPQEDPSTRLRISRDGTPALTVSLRVLPDLTVHPSTGRDVTGDGEPDVVLRGWGGGNHSGDDLLVYAGSSSGLHRVGHLDGYGCASRLVDLDADGVPELVTCDPDGFDVPSAPVNCAEAWRPRPAVIYRFDPAVERYRLATPRFRARRAAALRRQAATAIEVWRRGGARDAGQRACQVWEAGLDLLFSGDAVRAEQTLRVLHADTQQQERFRTDLWALLRRRPWYLATARPDAPLLPR